MTYTQLSILFHISRQGNLVRKGDLATVIKTKTIILLCFLNSLDLPLLWVQSPSNTNQYHSHTIEFIDFSFKGAKD